MNTNSLRRHIPAVLMAASLATVAACGSAPARAGGSPDRHSAATPHYGTIALPGGIAPSAIPAADAGALTISNGTDTVQIAGSAVHFPTTVTDAAWSHDGSRIAFVDADGNIATARPNGTDVQALTTTNHSVKRADPTWIGSAVAFSERDKDGVWRLKEVDLGNAVLAPQTATEIDFIGGRGASAPSHSAPLAASPNYVAFQHGTGAAAQVWIADLSQRVPQSHMLASHGSQPAISTDGNHVAFLGSDGQVYVADPQHPSAAPVEVTFGLTGVAHPAWSADDHRITVTTARGVSSVASKPTRPGANPATELSSKPGIATYAPTTRDTLVRIAADDAVGESVTLSRRTNPHAGVATIVTLVSTSDPGALASLPTIDWNGGPMLLTDGRTLDPRTTTEIKRLLGHPSQNTSVQILGGSGVITDSIAATIKNLGYPTSRIGYTTDDTSDDNGPASNGLYIVASDNDPAVLANQMAAASDIAATVVLVHNGALSVPQQALFGAHARVYVTDPAAAAAMAAAWQGIPKPTMTIQRIDAASADESALLAPAGPTTISLVGSGDRVQLLLAAFYQPYGGVVIVAGNGALPPTTAAWLAANAPTIDTVRVFGSVPPSTVASVGSAISGAAGYGQADA